MFKCRNGSVINLVRKLRDKSIKNSLTGVVQWSGCCLANQKITVSIPGQGTCLGCLARSPDGGIQEATNLLSHINVSLRLFLPPFPSL